MIRMGSAASIHPAPICRTDLVGLACANVAQVGTPGGAEDARDIVPGGLGIDFSKLQADEVGRLRGQNDAPAGTATLQDHVGEFFNVRPFPHVNEIGTSPSVVNPENAGD